MYFKCANQECNWHGYDSDKRNVYDGNGSKIGTECPKCSSKYYIMPTNSDLDDYGVTKFDLG